MSYQNIRLLAVAVFYNPDETAFLNLRYYLFNIDYLLIWDNTPDAGNLQKIKSKLKQKYPESWSKIHCMSTGENEGLSYAYNQAIKYAIDKGYTHIMTMDQDSIWVDFPRFLNFAIKYFEDNGPALIGPKFNDNESSRMDIKEVPNIINSGAIFPLEVVTKIGYYCERMLVDAVDVEFCYRAHRYGIPVLVVGGRGTLIQKFGNPIYFKFNGNQWFALNYSPFRLFGTLRNHVLVARLYPEQSEVRYFLKNVYLKQYTIAILLKEKNKIRKLFAIYKGLLCGIFTTKSLDAKYSKA